MRLIEPGPVGGNHLWSFFDGDVAARNRWLIEPLIAHRWSGYDVAFPAYRRAIAMPYNSIDSETLAEAVAALLPPERLIAKAATRLAPQSVLLEGSGTSRESIAAGRNSSGRRCASRADTASPTLS